MPVLRAQGSLLEGLRGAYWGGIGDKPGSTACKASALYLLYYLSGLWPVLLQIRLFLIISLVGVAVSHSE